jgi:hypothetical protein
LISAMEVYVNFDLPPETGAELRRHFSVVRGGDLSNVYRTALRKYAEERVKAVERVEVGEEPFRGVVHAADLGRLTQLAEEVGKAFEKALDIL